jgi:hypothetical protein
MTMITLELKEAGLAYNALRREADRLRRRANGRGNSGPDFAGVRLNLRERAKRADALADSLSEKMKAEREAS